MDRRSQLSPSRCVRFCIVALAMLLGLSVALAGERGHCITANIPETFVLPDGTVHPAGLLRLCLNRQLSPVSGAHHTMVDGRAVGYFRSVKIDLAVNSQPELDGPYFEFARNGDGSLELQHYVWSNGRDRYAYDLTQLNRKKPKFSVTTRQHSATASNQPVEPEPRREIIRLAGLRR